MRLRFLLPAVLIALIAAKAAPAESPDASSTAFRRSAELARGINLSGWFASSGDLSAAHIAKHTTPADLKLIHDLGFTYVRIGIDPTQFTRSGLNSSDTAAALARLDTALDQALAAHLAVALTLFPTDDFKRNLSNQSGAEQFVYLWRALAEHYAASDPDRVFFELLNEPEMTDAYRWDGLQAAAINAIRGVDTHHTIIATASNYSGLPDLLRVQPVRDANVIYAFHFYEPYPFTHQSASWGSFEWNFFRDVPYPATPEALRASLANVPDESARYVLYLYGAQGWNRESILGRLEFARDWADRNHVPIICNEFGAYRDAAPNESRMRYLRDVRIDLEQLHIGWAMWDYSGNFGLVRKTPDGRIVPDAATAEALGLTGR